MAEAETPASWTQPGRFGAPEAGIVVAEAAIGVAWNLQGDLARKPFAAAALRQFGAALPTIPNRTARYGVLTALWLGPRSWLLVTGDGAALADFEPRRDAVNAAGGALFDVSAARVAWTFAGPRTADVLAAGCPLDFHPRAFPPGTCAQSLYGHVGALFLRGGDGTTFTVMVPRSYARDAWHSLLDAALPYGVEVRPPAPFV